MLQNTFRRDDVQKFFINHTNHPSAKWSAEQISAAKIYGEIKDFPFPIINPRASTKEVEELVQANLKKILELEPCAVLCQGEFNYTFAMVEKLKGLEKKVFAATSKRISTVENLSDDSSRQISTFRFVKFREY